MRADARDNRARILAAATEVFGASGPGASTEEVAKRAGVGIGTVFRHFPTKPDLVAAVFTDRLERLRDRAADLADADDPGGAFLGFIAEVILGAPSKLALADELDMAPEGAHEAGEGLRAAFAVLMERAQQAGAVRRDVSAPEVYALMIGVSRAVATVPMDAATRDRTIALALDALRPGASADA